jgi:hypothetical protein
MARLDLKGQKTCIFGIQKSGKTTWAKRMYKHFKSPIAFVVNEDDGWNKLPNLHVYEADRMNVARDFELFIKWARVMALERKIDLIIIDEADMFFRGNYDINPDLHDLVLNHRHMGSSENPHEVAIWFMTRRPQDIPTKIVESSAYLVIFKLEGVNALKRFDDIHPEIRPLIERLDFRRHDFVFKELGQAPVLHAPLKL